MNSGKGAQDIVEDLAKAALSLLNVVSSHAQAEKQKRLRGPLEAFGQLEPGLERMRGPDRQPIYENNRMQHDQLIDSVTERLEILLSQKAQEIRSTSFSRDNQEESNAQLMSLTTLVVNQLKEQAEQLAQYRKLLDQVKIDMNSMQNVIREERERRGSEERHRRQLEERLRDERRHREELEASLKEEKAFRRRLEEKVAQTKLALEEARRSHRQLIRDVQTTSEQAVEGARAKLETLIDEKTQELVAKSGGPSFEVIVRGVSDAANAAQDAITTRMESRINHVRSVTDETMLKADNLKKEISRVDHRLWALERSKLEPPHAKSEFWQKLERGLQPKLKARFEQELKAIETHLKEVVESCKRELAEEGERQFTMIVSKLSGS
ncbi:hypothetical protein BJ742DRAFT_777691 [Cladochytrium replicatum]|nr:hypothetical protein BJ742DRAFT_777691 [Cladochytrium replicatum]